MLRFTSPRLTFELKEFKECQDQLLDFSSRFPKSPLLAKARLLFWQTSIELKDGQAVLNSLKGAASLESNPDALFYQAQAHELLDEASKALPIYQRLHYEFPLYCQGRCQWRRVSPLWEAPTRKFPKNGELGELKSWSPDGSIVMFSKICNCSLNWSQLPGTNLSISSGRVSLNLDQPSTTLRFKR